MKLRVRLNKHTSRLELGGDAPSLTDLTIQIKEILLPSCDLSSETEFKLSLNGKEPLIDSGQSLTSCGIVSGDLICVILTQTDSPALSVLPSHNSSSVTFPTTPHENQPKLMKPSSEASTSSCQVPMREEEEKEEVGDLETDQGSGLDPFSPEPMLCSEAEDGKVPHSLDVLHHRAQCQGTCDSLVVAAHCLMLETGFIPVGFEGRCNEMPIGWRAEGGMYKLQYTHQLCGNGLVVIAAVPMGNTLVVNATLKINDAVDNAQKLLLKPSAYVTDKWAAGQCASIIYKNLKKLSRIFKDHLIYPLIASARQAMNLPAVFGPTALPPELLLRILRLLDVASVVALSAVNRDLHIATNDLSLWKHLYHRDFRDLTNRPRDTDWKDLYKKKYKQRREEGRFRRTRLFLPVPPQPLPFRPFPYNPNPLYPPGIIGGEYDQRPEIPYSLLPRPRFDPIGPQPGSIPDLRGSIGRGSLRPSGGRSADIRRGFI
ncbi:F-box only protein 7 isoform X1 [Arapaima gigas]